jgi:hypothetical protein
VAGRGQCGGGLGGALLGGAQLADRLSQRHQPHHERELGQRPVPARVRGR